MDDLFGVTELLEHKAATDMEQGETREVDDKTGPMETRIERV